MEIKKFRILSDVVIIAIGVGLVELTKIIPVTRRGFYCDDESIRYPSNGETITELMVHTLLFASGLMFIIPTEYFLHRKGDQNRIYLSGFMVSQWIHSAYRHSVNYTVAALFTQIFLRIMKAEAGVLHPTFIHQCNPNVNISNCAHYNNSYITDYECLNGEEPRFHTSFPSEHSMDAAFVTFFCVLYAQVKWRPEEGSLFRLWKHIIQGAVATGCFFVALSRYADNIHHPLDIIVGYLLGIVFGLFTAVHVCGLTNPTTLPSDLEESPLNPNRRSSN